jgi:site-specific DNA-methyltransferase (adenine-specific)
MYPTPVHHTAHTTAPELAAQSSAFHARARATPHVGLDERMPINQMLRGNCVDVLAGLPASSAAFCLTDPPYLVGYRDRSGRSIAGDLLGDAPVIGAAFAEVFRVLAPDTICVSFYGWNRTDLFFDAWKRAGFRVVGHVTFPKRYHSGSRLMRYTHEGAYVLAKGQPQPPEYPIADVIDWGVASGNKLHPTQKPTQILTPLIESFCPPGGVVLDPFAGSGSTCVAALSVGRRFVGIEMDDRFHQVACRRLENYGRRMAMGLGFALDHVPAGGLATASAH